MAPVRSEEHTSELQSPIDISYAVFCLKKKKKIVVARHRLCRLCAGARPLARSAILFFFLMMRRPPRSTRRLTLFPYTTLFRSLRHVVLDAAVRTGRDLPLPAQLEVAERVQRHQVAALGGLSVRQLGDGAARNLLDGAIHHHPMGRGNGIVAQPAPPAQGATVEQQPPTGGSFGSAQIVRARLGAEHGAVGRQGEDPPSSLDHMLPRFSSATA